MYLRSILFLISTCLCLTATAQQFEFSGIVYKKASQDRISQVLVTNKQTGNTRINDELGVFHVQAKIGDTLLFQKVGYSTSFFVVFSTLETIVYMQPNILLDEVVIKEETKKHEINDVINAYRSKGLYYDGKPPISAFSPFGGSIITGFYELFGKDARNERRFIKNAQDEQETIEINKRYNTALVKRITGLATDKEAHDFMEYITPSLADIREWNDYQLIGYIKRSFEYYKNNKPHEVRLPKLY